MAERRSIAQVIAIALVMGALVFGWWYRRSADPSSPHSPASGAAGMERTQPTPAAGPPARPIESVRVPLPPPGTPVPQIAGPLKARADAGDSRAACRLAVELLRCQNLEQAKSMQWADGVPPDVSMERQGNLEAANAFAEIEIRKIQLGQHCQALDPALVAQAPQYLERAARSGEPEAMLRYATGEHHGRLGQMGFIREPGFERWRRDAPAMLLRAAQAGRMEAVHALRYAYGTDGEPYAGLIPDDPLQAHAWALLDARLRGSVRSAFENPDPGIEAEAAALARKWHQRYFKGAVTGSDRPPLMLQPLDFPSRPLEDERFCE